jgi:hypothetical protein
MNMAWTFTGGMCHRRAVRALDRACATGLRARAPSAEPLLAFLCDAVVPHPWYRTICISGAESPARTPATAGRARSGRGRGRGPAAIPGSARPPPGPRRARQDPAPADPARRKRRLARPASGHSARRKRPLAVLGTAGYGAAPAPASAGDASTPTSPARRGRCSDERVSRRGRYSSKVSVSAWTWPDAARHERSLVQARLWRGRSPGMNDDSGLAAGGAYDVVAVACG